MSHTRPAETIETDHLIGVSEASQMGVSALARNAENGETCVLMRNSKPIAAIVPMEVYYAWMRKELA